jgi:DNA processing protein
VNQEQLQLFGEYSVIPQESEPVALPSESAETEQGSSRPSVGENAISLLALADVEGVGFATARALFDAYHGHLTQVWNARSDELLEHLRNARVQQPNQIVQQIQSRADMLLTAARDRYLLFQKRRHVSILFRGTVDYPPGLSDLPNAPPWLFVEGNVDILFEPTIVGVVGTRDPTEDGIEAARRLSVDLARAGCIVLSGLAEGIDEVAHRTAVDYGAPTIAVLGHGIDVVFPASTADLRRQMIGTGGAVVSEYLPRDLYSRDRFVQRNRIQAALSTALAIVEGQSRSGTAHTLRFARQLKRHLFGVRLGAPVKIPQQELLNDLEKQGAPVYDLATSEGRDQLREFLGQLFPREQRRHRTGARLFLGLLNEINRIARDYDATQADFEWLVKEIQAYAAEDKRAEGQE